ncbi:MAG: alpha/beta fold hydrolase, partial [Acidobacteriota bacterium]
ALCVPGVAGAIFYLRPLARHLEGRQVFAFQAAGLESSERPDGSVEEIAERYLGELRDCGGDRVPKPWVLIGHSFGAKVIFEMARRAAAAGLPVGALMILDSPAPTAAIERVGVGWDDYDWLAEVLAQWTGWSEADAPTGLQSAAALRALGEEAWQAAAAHLNALHGGTEQSSQLARLRGMVRVCKAGQRRDYFPEEKPLDLPVHLFRAEVDLDLHSPAAAAQAALPDMGWSRFSSRVAVHGVPGDHISMMAEPHVRVLARKISRVFDSISPRA